MCAILQLPNPLNTYARYIKLFAILKWLLSPSNVYMKITEGNGIEQWHNIYILLYRLEWIYVEIQSMRLTLSKKCNKRSEA